jgi:microcin C transport system substrate-binding protein
VAKVEVVQLRTVALLVFFLAALSTSPVTAVAPPKRMDSFSLFGDPALPAGFQHFQYANPEAPKGGTVRFCATGTFDTFNPFSPKGVPPVDPAGLLVEHDFAPRIPAVVFESLATTSADELFTMYGLVADEIDVAKDGSSVTFSIRPEARFQNGDPITVDDVIYTFHLLQEKGHPNYRLYFSEIDHVEKIDPRSVRFGFTSKNRRELALVIGRMPILSKSYWKSRDITSTTLEPPLGSGPYRVADFEPGRYVIYKRVPDYWGRSLSVNVGRYNFDAIRVDFFRDDTVALEAFKAGQCDIRWETKANNWFGGYGTPAVERGEIVKERIPVLARGAQVVFFNTRRSIFRDGRVRQAIIAAFDFESTNKTLAYGEYTRARGYFDGGEFEAKGVPTGRERELLLPFQDRIPSEIFMREYNPPSTASRTLRDNLLEAYRLLQSAGWQTSKDGKLRDAGGYALSFEILNVSPAYERILLPLAENLKRLGMEARIRTVDAAQFIARRRDFDYDMLATVVTQSDNFNRDLRDQWASSAAGTTGSSNFAGVRDPVVDTLLENLSGVDDRNELKAQIRALDRVLQWGYYAIPIWYGPFIRIARWAEVKRPGQVPLLGPSFSTWWIGPSEDYQHPLK